MRILLRSPSRLILFGFYPAAPMTVHLWVGVLMLIFGGCLLGRWLHPVTLGFALVGVVLLFMAKSEIVVIRRGSISVGSGLWWQRHRYAGQRIKAVDIESWMLEDTDPLERDVLFRVALQVADAKWVPLCQRWRDDRAHMEALVVIVKEYLRHA